MFRISPASVMQRRGYSFLKKGTRFIFIASCSDLGSVLGSGGPRAQAVKQHSLHPLKSSHASDRLKKSERLKNQGTLLRLPIYDLFVFRRLLALFGFPNSRHFRERPAVVLYSSPHCTHATVRLNHVGAGVSAKSREANSRPGEEQGGSPSPEL